MPQSANWNYPTAYRFGPGRVVETAEACTGLGIKNPLLVTDPGLAALPFVEAIMQSCRDAGLGIALFKDIKSNPTGENVDAGLAAFRAGDHDGVIALGGGSGLDAAKAVAVMARQSCSLWDLEDVGDNWKNADPDGIAPVLAIPTTAGTGSEVGRGSVITDQAAHVKKIIFHPAMMPQMVIADPELTLGLPKHITAATGMDALSHNLEAFCAPGYHPMARGIAIEGIRLIKEWLPQAVAQGSDIEARGQMLVASSMGATAFQRGLGAMHALAHPLGALYDAHHGLLNAILMPYVLTANRPSIEEELNHLAICLGLEDAEGFLAWVIELRREIGIPNSLAEIGIDAARAEQVGAMAVVDPSGATNPIEFTAEDYAVIFKKAVHGDA